MRHQQSSIGQLCACLLAQGKSGEVQDLIKKNMHSTNEAELRYYQSLSLAMQGKIEEASGELQKVLELDPDFDEARHLGFEIFLNEAGRKMIENDWKGLSSVLTAAVKAAPDTPEAKKRLEPFRDALPVSYIRAGKRGDAAAIWEGEISEDPGNLSVIHCTSLLYYWWAVHEEAEYKKREAWKDPAGAGSQEMKAFDAKINLLWRKAISYWGLLVQADRFWEGWKSQRGAAWSSEIPAEDVQALKKSFVKDRFENHFQDYIDFYRQSGSEKDALRHESYLEAVILEQESSRAWKEAMPLLESKLRIKPENSYTRMELVRTVQQLEGGKPCFGTEKDCRKSETCIWGRYCCSDRDRKIVLNLPGGYTFFEEREMTLEVYRLVRLLHISEPDNVNIATMRLLFFPFRLGIIYTQAMKQYRHEKAVAVHTTLPDKVKNAVESKYLLIMIKSDTAKEKAEAGDQEGALSGWIDAYGLATDANMAAVWQAEGFSKPVQEAQKDLEKRINEAVIDKAKLYKKNNKLNDAVNLLESTYQKVKTREIGEYLVDFYCDLGNEKINMKDFAGSRTVLEKALRINPNHSLARKTMAISYNNEGLQKTDAGQSLTFLEKAYEYDPTNQTIRSNLVGAYNQRAVSMLNSLQASYSKKKQCEDAIQLLIKGITMLSAEFDREDIDFMKLASDLEFEAKIKLFTNQQLQQLLKNLREAFKIQRMI